MTYYQEILKHVKEAEQISNTIIYDNESNGIMYFKNSSGMWKYNSNICKYTKYKTETGFAKAIVRTSNTGR